MTTLVTGDRSFRLTWGDGAASQFHYVWLRDNCWCDECRVGQTGERKLFTATIPHDITPVTSSIDGDGSLHVTWNDGHSSSYSERWLQSHDYSNEARASRIARPVLWGRELAESLPAFDHGSVTSTVGGQLAFLEELRDFGAALVKGVPSVDREVERFAATIGHVREVAFERVHNVYHDPAGYNVAHTSQELKPHTDFPSYSWPPSVQLLHYLVNEAAGGETVLVDGWKVLADLRGDDPGAFDVLCRVPVPFQLFSDTEDTYAVAPLVQLNGWGDVQTLRFSNQLVQPLDVPSELVDPFYDAYRKLGAMIDEEANRVVFKTESGDLVATHGHRVLHGRLGFDSASGPRHLQDVYMEWDDLMARIRVLKGVHRPLPATPGS